MFGEANTRKNSITRFNCQVILFIGTRFETGTFEWRRSTERTKEKSEPCRRSELTWPFEMAIMRNMKVSVAEAKNRLTELIRAAENGEKVTICRRGEPVVDIVPTNQPSPAKRKLGTLRGKIVVHDPDWWKPMTDEEVDAFLEGRY